MTFTRLIFLFRLVEVSVWFADKITTNKCISKMHICNMGGGERVKLKLCARATFLSLIVCLYLLKTIKTQNY